MVTESNIKDGLVVLNAAGASFTVIAKARMVSPSPHGGMTCVVFTHTDLSAGSMAEIFVTFIDEFCAHFQEYA